MRWPRDEFNTFLSVSLWDFLHCWINFLLIQADFPRCLWALARRADVCLWAGGGGKAMTYCAFSQLRSVSSIIQGNMVAHACRGRWGVPQPGQIFIITPSFPPSDRQSKQSESESKLGSADPLTFGDALLLSTPTRGCKLQEASLILILYARYKEKLFPSFLSPSRRNGKRGIFTWRESVDTQGNRKSNSEGNSGPLSFSTKHAL